MSQTTTEKYPQPRINFKCVAMRLRVLRQNLLGGEIQESLLAQRGVSWLHVSRI